MLTRVTSAAQSVMARAYECARRDHAAVIGEEHVLEALLADPQAARVLGGRSVVENVLHTVRDALDERRRKGGVTAAEEGALAELGINLDAVVDQIEDQLGAGALASDGPKRTSWWRRPVFSADVVRVLAEAERHLAATGKRSLDLEHLVLALVSVPSVTAESLARQGVDEASLRTVLDDEGRAGGEGR